MSAWHPLVSLITASILVAALPAQTKTLRMKTPQRASAPIQISGVVFSDTTLVVRLVNVSHRDVTRVTMGVVLEDASAAVPPVTRTGIACDATVPADGFLVVREANVGFDMAASHFRSNGITEAAATIGVTSVRFADGTEWNYPLTEKGRFEEQVDEVVRDAVAARVKKQFPDDKDMSWLDPNPNGKFSICRKQETLPPFARAVEGKVVWITTTDGQRRKGLVTAASPAGLTWDKLPSRPLSFQEIARIEKVSHRLRNGVWIGLAAGAGLQLWLTGASFYPDESCLMATFLCAGGVLAIGVGTGTAIGLLTRDADVIYEAKPRKTTSAMVVPMLSPGRKGVAVAISWR